MRTYGNHDSWYPHDLQCSECLQEFPTVDDLLVHVAEVHEPEEREQDA